MARKATIEVRIERAATQFVNEYVHFTSVQRDPIVYETRYSEVLFNGSALDIRISRDDRPMWNIDILPRRFEPRNPGAIHIVKRYVKSEIARLTARDALALRNMIVDFRVGEFAEVYHILDLVTSDWDEDLAIKVFIPFMFHHFGLIMEDIGNAGSD